jgi:hypothetical protein
MRQLHPNRATPRAPHRLSSRLTRRVPALSRTGVALTAVTVSVLVWLPPVTILLAPTSVGTELFWPLMLAGGACLVCVLLPELAHYGTGRVGPVVLIVLGGMYLFFVVAWTFDTALLIERGRWADTVVVSRREPQSRGTPQCTLREVGVEKPMTTTMSNCRHQPGDRLRVFADPSGETGANLSRPDDLSPERELTALCAASVTTGALTGALSGYKRRRALGLLGVRVGEAEARFGRVERRF